MDDKDIEIKEETIDLVKMIIPESNQNCVNDKLTEIVNKKPFQCEICKIRFTQETSLSVHTASVHEGKKAFLSV